MSVALGVARVGTEALLIAVARHPDSLGGAVLADLGVAAEVEAAVRRRLDSYHPRPAPCSE